MFSPYHSSGFYYTPVTKGLLTLLILASVAFNVPLSAYRRWFTVTYSTVFEHVQFDKFLASRCVFLDPKDILCAAVLLYHFRIFERRYGSTKFMSYVLGSWCISMILELCFLYLFHHLDIRVSRQLGPLPTGPWGAVFALFIPYFSDIPRVAVMHVWGIPVTGKSVTYIIGLQMMSSSLESLLLALCGLLSGLVYKNDMLLIQSWLKVPRPFGDVAGLTVGHLFTSPAPKDLNTPMGATLELQRLHRIEQLEQQSLWAQIPQQQAQGGFGLFRRTPAPPTDAQIESNVQSLVDMGFTRDRAAVALRQSANNLEVATNLLLVTH